jgi:3'-phosphoadenosine 5'-phosphosulfate sulfotransferase
MSELAKKPSSTCARFTRLFLLGALASVFNIGCSPKPEAPAFSEQTPSTKPSVITVRSTQAQQQTVRVRALYSSTQCPVTKAQFRLMATEEWSQLTRPAHHLGETSSDAPPSSDHEHWILVKDLQAVTG